MNKQEAIEIIEGIDENASKHSDLYWSGVSFTAKACKEIVEQLDDSEEVSNLKKANEKSKKAYDHLKYGNDAVFELAVSQRDEAYATIDKLQDLADDLEFQVNSQTEMVEAQRETIKKLEAKLKKTVVPQFVADWYEENKDNLDDEIYDLCVMHSERGELDFQVEFNDWFNNNKTKPIETLIRMKDGYEVEKEPQWVVTMKNGDFISNLTFHNDGTHSLGVANKSNNTLKFTNKQKAEAVALLVDGEVVEVEG